ncbi:TolC family protein [Thiohalophilus sp.]|uniref:TolC family protein n=1 Tax=Thiohalophilus sp. TaxID=3028392 RepID=UPI002ACE0D1A|nr:TolC family protein [Thiohalophilus sp.]MDZ7663512.1 TolC family protein [Thiohalophilus sp.]
MLSDTAFRQTGWLALLLFCGLTTGFAQQQADEKPAPLPEPLTLEKALALADEPHPELQIAEARIRAAEAELQGARAGDDTAIYVDGALAYVAPPDYALNQDNDDHRLILNLDKTLYDFGRTRSASDAAARQLDSSKLLQVNTRQQRRLAIMQRFFDVVLADLQYYRYNEEMAVEFVELDKMRDRHELKQISDLELLEQDAVFQRARHLRAQSQNRQRETRARLAQALNRPGQLPRNVVPPTLPTIEQELPEVESLQTLALRENPVVQSLREQVEATRARVAEARAGNNPTIQGKLQAGAYSRERNSYDDFRAELQLTVPLYDGSRTDAGVAREKARLFETQSRLTLVERDVRQQVLELWLQLDSLKAKREQRETEKRYRELYLDRSRALYELEVKADLGDSMVRYTEAERNSTETDYETALAWARLNALLGRLDLDKAFVPPKNLSQKDETDAQAE